MADRPETATAGLMATHCVPGAAQAESSAAAAEAALWKVTFLNAR